MKTALIIVFMSLANPSEPSRLIHRTFESSTACQRAYENVFMEAPADATIKMAAFCVPVSDLAE